MPERRGSMLYDPARDIFTKSLEQQDSAAESQPEDNSQAQSKRKRSSSMEGPSAQPPHRLPPTAETAVTSEHAAEPAAKKIRQSPEPIAKGGMKPMPLTEAALSQISASRKKGPANGPNAFRERRDPPPLSNRRRSRSPTRSSPESRRRERRRSPPRRRTPSPKAISRSPTPPPRSPPRERKRPGGGARISAVDREAARRRQLEREQEQKQLAHQEVVARGVHDVVKQHYNAVPQRGREWRKTGSLIKGLRSFNNWVKSAIIQKFSPSEGFDAGAQSNYALDESGLLVLDIGCGKGGDLQKWHAAPQRVDLYVGLDPADVSIGQARERYAQMQKGRGGHRERRARPFHAEFVVKDCFGEWIGEVPIVQEVGIDGSVGPDGAGLSARWGGGGFDVVTMMFCLHYAFESEEKANMILRNVAGALKKGGRFIGVIPNSDILTAKVKEFNAKRGKVVEDADDDDDWDPEKPAATKDSGKQEANGDVNGEQDTNDNLEWGNGIYRVKFPGKVPDNGIFRPAFGWKYFYYLEEAVEEIPEYVVPWEKLRSMAEDYNLELQFRQSFSDVWASEQDDPVLGPLSERMNVRERDRGPLLVSDEEFEAAGFYHAFCFYKV